MGMSLSDIEAKADELAEALDGAGAALAKDLTTKLEGLAYAVQIKATAAHQRRVAEQPMIHLQQGPQHGYFQGVPVSPPPLVEPTKPAIDRLHELVSYFIQQANDCANEAARNRDVVGQEARKQPADYMAVVYNEAADKLRDILDEGGL